MEVGSVWILKKGIERRKKGKEAYGEAWRKLGDIGKDLL